MVRSYDSPGFPVSSGKDREQMTDRLGQQPIPTPDGGAQDVPSDDGTDAARSDGEENPQDNLSGLDT